MTDLLQQAMDEAKDAIVEAAGEAVYNPEGARIKRIAYLDEERRNTRWWQVRRRRYLRKQIHKEAAEGYWAADNPRMETMFRALMEQTRYGILR